MNVDLSIVVAVYNEDPQNLAALLDRLQRAMKPTNLNYEVIFVNDGSSSRTSMALRKFAEATDYIKLVVLSRNFGQQAAITAGIDHAAGDAVVNIDSDLQDPPELIPEMVKRWHEGFEVVYAKRLSRRDRLSKRLAAHLFYRLLSSISSIDIPWDTGDFRLLDRKVVDALKSLPEKTRFVRGLVPWLGFKQIGIPIDRDARQLGASTYTLRKLMCLALDGLLSLSVAPLYFVAFMGAALLALGVFALLVLSVTSCASVLNLTGPALALIMVILSGVQLLATGIVAIYLSKIIDEVRARPTYIVSERIGIAFARETQATNPLLNSRVL